MWVGVWVGGGGMAPRNASEMVKIKPKSRIRRKFLRGEVSFDGELRVWEGWGSWDKENEKTGKPEIF